MSSALKNIIKHSAVYAAGSFLSSATGFLLIPIYTRYLLPADYGMLEILNVSIQVLTIFCLLGVTNGMDKAFLKDANTEEIRKITVTTATVFVLLSSVAILGVCVFFAKKLSALLFGDTRFSFWFAIVFATSFIRLNSHTPLRLLRAELKSVRYAAIEFTGFVVTIGFTIYFVVVRRLGVVGVLYGDLIGSSTVLLGSLVFLRKYLVRHFSPAILKQMLRFGVPLVPAMLAFWILRVSDRYFLQYYASPHEVGLYAMGVRFAVILELLFYAPFNYNWPAIYFRVVKQQNAREEFSSILTYFLLAICFFALAISTFSRPAIHLMTTPAFYGACKVVPVLIISTIFLGIYSNVTVGVGITGKTEYHAMSVVLAALVNIALNFLLIPTHGMLGAAAATAIAYGVKMVAGYAVSMKLYPVHYDYPRLAKIAAAFCLPFVLHEMVEPGSTLLEMMLDAGLLAGYALLLFMFGFFSPGEINWMKSQWNKARHGFAEATVLSSKL